MKTDKIPRYKSGNKMPMYDVKKLSKQQIEDNILFHKLDGNVYQGADGKWYKDTYYSLRKNYTERRVDSEGKPSVKHYSQGFQTWVKSKTARDAAKTGYRP